MKSSRPKSTDRLGTGLAIGIGIGAALGVALDNLALGIAIGVGVGVALGSVPSREAGEAKEDDADRPNRR